MENKIKRGRKAISADQKVKPLTVYAKAELLKKHGAELKEQIKQWIREKMENDTFVAIIFFAICIAGCFADNIF